MNRNELFFDVSESPEGGSDAQALGHAVVAQGEEWDDLKEPVRDAVRDAVRCHFVRDDAPGVIRLHYARDDAVAV